MITVEEALSLIRKSTPSLGITKIKTKDSLHRTLAEDVLSTINLPPFNQSAMDGFAININSSSNNYNIIGEIKAGDSITPTLNKGDAVRIFTGAAVPPTSNAVIMQEKTETQNSVLSLLETPEPNINIRKKGEQISAGDLALKTGTTITPATIGFLQMIGVEYINTFKIPKVSIIVTGNELVPVGRELNHGEVYECNSSMIAAALSQFKINANIEPVTQDTLQDTIQSIEGALDKSDLIILTGGISVGDYDFVKPALEALEVKSIFYKVKQKPGKPLFVGKKGEKLVFALPGNPSASLMCFYQYISESLKLMSGGFNNSLPVISCITTNKFIKKGERAQFLWGKTDFKNVEILSHQNSSMLRTFAEANALVYMPLEKKEISEGDNISTMIISNYSKTLS